MVKFFRSNCSSFSSSDIFIRAGDGGVIPLSESCKVFEAIGDDILSFDICCGDDTLTPSEVFNLSVETSLA